MMRPNSYRPNQQRFNIPPPPPPRFHRNPPDGLRFPRDIPPPPPPAGYLPAGPGGHLQQQPRPLLSMAPPSRMPHALGIPPPPNRNPNQNQPMPRHFGPAANQRPQPFNMPSNQGQQMWDSEFQPRHSSQSPVPPANRNRFPGPVHSDNNMKVGSNFESGYNPNTEQSSAMDPISERTLQHSISQGLQEQRKLFNSQQESEGVHDVDRSETSKDSDQIWLNQWLERRRKMKTDERLEKSPKYTVIVFILISFQSTFSQFLKYWVFFYHFLCICANLSLLHLNIGS